VPESKLLWLTRFSQVANRPTLVRWDPQHPVTLENIVVMDFPDAEKHTKECFGVLNKQMKPSGKAVPSSMAADGDIPRTSSPNPLTPSDSSISSTPTTAQPLKHLSIPLRPDMTSFSSRESSLSMSSASVEFVTPQEEFSTPSSELADEPQDVSDRLEVRYHSRNDTQVHDDEKPETEKDLEAHLKRPVDLWGEEVERLVQAKAREVEKYRQWVLSI
jgi:hypothetical protein